MIVTVSDERDDEPSVSASRWYGNYRVATCTCAVPLSQICELVWCVKSEGDYAALSDRLPPCGRKFVRHRVHHAVRSRQPSVYRSELQQRVRIVKMVGWR